MAIRVVDVNENEQFEQTMRVLLGEYRLSLEAAGRSPKTISWYLDILNDFFFNFLPTDGALKSISDIGKAQVRNYIKRLQIKRRWPKSCTQSKDYGRLSPHTIQGKVRTIKVFWSWLFREKHVAANPIKDLLLPKVPNLMIPILTVEQIGKLLKSIDKYVPLGARNYSILLLLIDTGMRVSELINIKIADIDMTRSLIKVTGKGRKERTVPISSRVRKELNNYISRYRPILCPQETKYLFPTKDRGHISVSCVQQMIRRLVSKAGLQGIKCHPHIFRHTFATMFSANGGSLEILKSIMGHESPQTTEKYLHPQQDSIKKQHAKYSPLNELFRE